MKVYFFLSSALPAIFVVFYNNVLVYQDKKITYAGTFISAIFDVTNVTTHFVKLYALTSHNIYFQSDTSGQRSGAIFIKLGDT